MVVFSNLLDEKYMILEKDQKIEFKIIHTPIEEKKTLRMQKAGAQEFHHRKYKGIFNLYIKKRSWMKSQK